MAKRKKKLQGQMHEAAQTLTNILMRFELNQAMLPDAVFAELQKECLSLKEQFEAIRSEVDCLVDE